MYSREGSLHTLEPAAVPGGWSEQRSGSFIVEPGQPGSAYSFERCLGEGSFGKTYLSFHSARPSHPVVIKVPHAKTALFLRDEASTLCTLHHPHIISVREVIELPDDRFFLVMEYAAGGSLDDRIARSRGNLPAMDVCRYLLQVMLALDYIHSKGVLHLDIKCVHLLTSSVAFMRPYPCAADQQIFSWLDQGML